jgi:hypothetical protein
MQLKRDAMSFVGDEQLASETELRIRKPSRLGRLFAVVFMGLVLLALTALFHSAAAATSGGGWVSLGAIWLAAILAILLAARGAGASVTIWRRMCLLDGLASLGLFAIGSVDLILRDTVSGIQPVRPVFGVAVASGVLAIAGLVLAIVLLVAWYLLSRQRTGTSQHA